MKSAPLFAALVACAAAKSNPAREVESVKRLSVDVDHDGAEDGHCTAWAYADHWWATAAHCVDLSRYRGFGDPSMNDLYLDGKQCYRGVALADDDIGVFYCPDVTARPLRIADAMPKFGEKVYYIGYPDDHLGVYDGRYTGPDGDPEAEGLDMFTAFVNGGASGSPVFNSSGEVIGIAVASYEGKPYSYLEPLVESPE